MSVFKQSITLNVDSLFVLLMCITAGCDFFSSGIQSHVLNWIRWATLWLFLIDVHSHRSRAHLYDPVLWNDTILTDFVHCEDPSLVQNNRSLTHPTWSHALKYDPPCLSPQRLANNSANSEKSHGLFLGWHTAVATGSNRRTSMPNPYILYNHNPWWDQHLQIVSS